MQPHAHRNSHLHVFLPAGTHPARHPLLHPHHNHNHNHDHNHHDYHDYDDYDCCCGHDHDYDEHDDDYVGGVFFGGVSFGFFGWVCECACVFGGCV